MAQTEAFSVPTIDIEALGLDEGGLLLVRRASLFTPSDRRVFSANERATIFRSMVLGSNSHWAIVPRIAPNKTVASTSGSTSGRISPRAWPWRIRSRSAVR